MILTGEWSLGRMGIISNVLCFLFKKIDDNQERKLGPFELNLYNMEIKNTFFCLAGNLKALLNFFLQEMIF